MRAQGLHDDKFKGKLTAQAQVKFFEEQRIRSLYTIDGPDLFNEAQKFSFSNDGKLMAVGSKDGSRISVVEINQEPG